MRIHSGCSGHSAQDSGGVLYAGQGTGLAGLKVCATFLSACKVTVFRASYFSGFSCVRIARR